MQNGIFISRVGDLPAYLLPCFKAKLLLCVICIFATRMKLHMDWMKDDDRQGKSPSFWSQFANVHQQDGYL